MQYKEDCPSCGAHLDPGEQCDCDRVCPTCGEYLTPGQRCDCYRKMLLDEVEAIHQAHKGKGMDGIINMMAAAHDLGYAKAEKENTLSAGDRELLALAKELLVAGLNKKAAHSATNTTDGQNTKPVPNQQINCTTDAGASQMEEL